MLRLVGILTISLFALFLPPQAHAQNAYVVATCGTLPAGIVYATGTPKPPTVDITGTLCTSAGGGGGGGLSVTDQTAWTQGTSAFTPSGGVYNDTATLSSGQEGTVRLNTKRAMIVDVDTTGSNLYAAATAAIPGYYATAYNTCSQTTGTTAPICVDLNGNMYANISRYFGTVASPSAAVMTVQPAGGDPCQTLAKTYTPINYSASGLNTTPLVAGTSAKLTYVCQIILNNNAAETVGIIETTTATSCATDVQSLWGGATHSSSSNGFQFAATSGVSIGNGSGTIAVTKTANDDICFIQSGSTQLTGGIMWVQK